MRVDVEGDFTVGERGPELGYKSGSSVQIYNDQQARALGGGVSVGRAPQTGGAVASSDGQPLVIQQTIMLDGQTVANNVERHMLRKGLGRGPGRTWQQFKK